MRDLFYFGRRAEKRQHALSRLTGTGTSVLKKPARFTAFVKGPFECASVLPKSGSSLHSSSSPSCTERPLESGNGSPTPSSTAQWIGHGASRTGQSRYPTSMINYDREGVRAPLPDDIQPGLTAITSSWRDSTSSKVGMKLLSREGNVVHQWLFDRDGVFPNDLDVKGDPENASISSSHLLPEGDLIVTLGYVGMARLDACGNVLWTLSEGVHHWGTRADDGSFGVPGVSDDRRNSSKRYPNGYPGIEKPVWLDES